MDIKVIYEDNDVLVADKPAGIVVFPEGQTKENTLIDKLIEKYPELKSVGEAPRYGIVHRLDKDTSGVLLVAKNSESLIFLQKQFATTSKSDLNGENSQTLEKNVEKRYIALVEGNINNDFGEIKTLIARGQKDKRKQKVYLLNEIGPGRREAITEYKVLTRYKDYTLLEVKIKTGRRHQIRCHFSYLQHPIAGDKLYSFKNSKIPEGLTRQFLHAQYLKIKMPDGNTKEFQSNLPEELETVLEKIK
ncbi:MAG: RNA pseudouridine synthase [Candidatus Staskawiczbacteria bacterium]|nr:RNA pseudouridine synthase [Candidatus Staskawiczbacteria bacterium]